MTLSGQHDRTLRAAAVALIFIALLQLAATSAFAHARLLRSEPEPGATLDAPPRLVGLWFSEELSRGFSAVEVTDAAGRRVDRGEVTHVEGGRKARIELGELPAGDYRVAWKVVSVDGHTIRGGFAFRVAPATPIPGPSEATQTIQSAGQGEGGRPVDSAPAGAAAAGRMEMISAGESAVTWLDSLVRWLVYLAMMTLLGGFASRLFVIGPAFACISVEGGGRGAAAAGVRRIVGLLRAAAMLLLPTLLVALALQSSAVNDVGAVEALSPALLVGVITQTSYGTAWLVTTMGAGAVAAVAFLLGRPGEDSPVVGREGLWWAGLLASAVMLVGPGLTGHAMAAAGQHYFAVVSDWLHLLAGGLWVGGLFHLALVTPAALARLGPGERGRALGGVITRFTRLAIPSVIVVSLAGLYNSWIHLGSFGALWGTAYGRTLLVKLLLVVLMLLLGAINGFLYGPRARGLAAADEVDGERGVERRFLRSAKIEAALGALVLLAAAVLVFVTPGRNDALEVNGGRAEQRRMDEAGR